jgi:hypothetical protein
VRRPVPCFIKFRLRGTEKNVRTVSPFYIQKALHAIAGKVKNAPWLKNGTLFV